MSVLRKTGIHWLRFTLVRLLHGILAFTATWLIWPLIRFLPENASSVFNNRGQLQSDLSGVYSLWRVIPQLLQWQGILLALMLGSSLLFMLLQVYRRKSTR